MQKIYLNDDWKYAKQFEKEMIARDYEEAGMETVRLPHTNIELPYHYFDESMYQFICGYRKWVEAPMEWKGQTVQLTFEGSAHVTRVYCNGQKAGSHGCGYTAFTVDISELLIYGEKNLITVEVDSSEPAQVPPFGNVIDYLTYGGLYREVYLTVASPCHLEDLFVTTSDVTQEKKRFQVQITTSKAAEALSVEFALFDKAGSVVYTAGETLSETVNTFSYKIDGVENWGIDNPVLYTLQMGLFQDGTLVDTKSVRFGFRECEFRADGFYLNQEKIKLVGLNRHQAYPYVGYAMPKGPQQFDADILKNELAVNAVRTSHYPQSHYFLDRCDEIGLLVFTEIPGWQHIGDKQWKQMAIKNAEDMVLQYRNHPSIILWGARINESQDDDAFYKKTNEVVHRLDPSRQTGGVRFLRKSHLLEDVYTYNDFLHNGENAGLARKAEVSPDLKKPYLISEFNGHMFPTKMFDCEDHRMEHALRHSRVLDALFADASIAGAFGWCMFDYNTHKEFGSGDRICYHGVLDMFRNPKYAAAVYASQGEEKPVLEIANCMEIGEHPAGAVGDVYLLTNADSVRLYKGETFIKEYTKKNSPYSHMPHGPIYVDDFIGDQLIDNEGFLKKNSDAVKEVFQAIQKYGQNSLPLKYKLKMAGVMLDTKLTMEEGTRLFTKYVSDWGGNTSTYRFEAYRNGEVFKVIEKGPQNAVFLKAEADRLTLQESTTYDVACIRLQAVDQHGNQLSFFNEPVRFVTEGEIELIGPEIISMQGGTFGTYVKTTGKAGRGTLTILPQSMNGLMKPQILHFTITEQEKTL